MALDWSSFKLGSSDIDWCEENYKVTNYIAEFYNTISNALFLIYPPILIYLYRKYADVVTSQCHVVWSLLIFVGLGSAYFHATLSLAGQLIDELGILWVLLAAIAAWLPNKYLLPVCRQKRKIFNGILLVCLCFFTLLSFVKPVANAFALLLSGIPITFIVIREIRRLESRRAYYLGIKVTVLWLLAVAVWLSDRFQCDYWRQLNFPYLHSIWHILMSVVSYQLCVLMSYVFAYSDHPFETAVLRYWPRDSYDVIGVPYIHVSDRSVTSSGHSNGKTTNGGNFIV